MKKESIIVLVFLAIISFVILFGIFNYKKPEILGLLNLIILVVLISITAVYVYFTYKMAEEMREQRVMSSRPVIIQKAIIVDETEFATDPYCDWFSHFEVYNVGNGPAIEVEISLIKQDKTPIDSERRTYLRAGEPPIRFPSNAPFERVKLEESTYYLASEYQSISSHHQQPMWYQTRLPFEVRKASEEGRIYVIAGELEFREVTEKDRIDAFSRRSKPK